MDVIKIENYQSTKDTIKTVKRQPKGREKILVNSVFDKGLVSRIYKKIQHGEKNNLNYIF